MDNATIINLDVDTRVDAAINRSMDIYMNKLATGFFEVGLENTFQMSLAGSYFGLTIIGSYIFWPEGVVKVIV